MIVSFMYCTLQPACLVFYLVCYPVWGVWSSGKTPQKLHCSCCGDLAMVRSWVSEQCKPNALLWNSLEIIVNDVRFQIWGLMCTFMYIHHIWYVYAKEKSLNCVLDSFAAYVYSLGSYAQEPQENTWQNAVLLCSSKWDLISFLIVWVKAEKKYCYSFWWVNNPCSICSLRMSILGSALEFDPWRR